MPRVLCQVVKSITPKLRKSSWQSFMGVRFNMYTYGAEIEVLSDHKPLESIFKKPLFKVPARLQRMRLRLQKYNLKVRYVPGKFLYIADTLSRAFDQSNVPTDDDMHHDMEHFIHSVIIDLPISDVKLMELRELNCNDPTMQILNRCAMEGWPNTNVMYLLLFSLSGMSGMTFMSQMEFFSRTTGLSFHIHGEQIYFRNCISATAALRKPKLMRGRRYFGLA